MLVSRCSSYTADLTAILFGRLLTVSTTEIVQTAVVTVAVLGVLAFLGEELLLRAFDADGARAMGYRTGLLDLVLNVLVALVVVAALLIVPAATARLVTYRIGAIGGIGAVAGALGGWLGRFAGRGGRPQCGPAGNAASAGCGIVEVRRMSKVGRTVVPTPAHTDPESRTRRKTRQGALVTEALGNADEFQSAQEVFATLRADGHNIGLTTVYRHLTDLADRGAVDVLRSADGENWYRKCRAEAHHHHLVCRACGRTVEIKSSTVERWAQKVAEDEGFSDISHTVEIFGLCRECRT